MADYQRIIRVDASRTFVAEDSSLWTFVSESDEDFPCDTATIYFSEKVDIVCAIPEGDPLTGRPVDAKAIGETIRVLRRVG